MRLDFSKGPVLVGDCIRVEVRYPDGTRKRKRFKKRFEARAWKFWHDEQEKLEKGTWQQSPARNLTVSEGLEPYREYSKQHHRSYETHIHRPLDFWIDWLGPKKLVAAVTVAQIAAAQKHLLEKFSENTTDKYLSVLKAAWNWMIDLDMAVTNPVRKVKFFNPDTGVIRFLSKEEFAALMLAAQALHRWHLVPIILIALNTGFRLGNITHLTWQQINFFTRMISIGAENMKGKKRHDFPMNDTVVRILTEVKNKTGHFKYVFCHQEGDQAGQPIRSVKTAFNKACTNAGIEDFRFYDLRHTFASWLVMAGVPLYTVSRLMGHASMKMTLKYAHLAPDYMAKEVSILDTITAGATEQKMLPEICPSTPSTQDISGQPGTNGSKQGREVSS